MQTIARQKLSQLADAAVAQLDAGLDPARMATFIWLASQPMSEQEAKATFAWAVVMLAEERRRGRS